MHVKICPSNKEILVLVSGSEPQQCSICHYRHDLGICLSSLLFSLYCHIGEIAAWQLAFTGQSGIFLRHEFRDTTAIVSAVLPLLVSCCIYVTMNSLCTNIKLEWNSKQVGKKEMDGLMW